MLRSHHSMVVFWPPREVFAAIVGNRGASTHRGTFSACGIVYSLGLHSHVAIAVAFSFAELVDPPPIFSVRENRRAPPILNPLLSILFVPFPGYLPPRFNEAAATSGHRGKIRALTYPNLLVLTFNEAGLRGVLAGTMPEGYHQNEEKQLVKPRGLSREN